MLKPIIAALLAFLVAGTALDGMTRLLSFDTKNLEGPPAQARFVEAASQGETVNPPDPNRPKDQGQGPKALYQRCTAENLPPSVHPYFVGIVTHIIDGDTLDTTVEGIPMRVRLWGIDAPEKTQQSGEPSTLQLESLAPVNSTVTIHPTALDDYGRLIASVSSEIHQAVNFQMVASGWAYHVDKYQSKNNQCLEQAQRTAQAHRLGVWKHGEQGMERPWDHRENQHNQNWQKPHQQEEEERLTFN